MQPVLERGRDAEVAAAAAQAPEQLGVLVRAGVHELPVGGHDVSGDQVVAGQADLAHEPADAAAERVTGDPGARHQPAGHGEPEGLGCVIEVRPRAAGLGDGRATGRVDADGGHTGQVDHDAAVAAGEAGDRVPAATDGDLQVLAAREVHRAHDVGDAGAPDDQRRAPVVGSVPDRARLVIAVVLGSNDLPAQALFELTERGFAELRGDGHLRRHGLRAPLCSRDPRTRSTLPGRS